MSTIKSSLLQKIKLQEIEDLITEYQLIDDQYKIYYFIDPYDIGKYAFPLGLVPSKNKDKREDADIEIITDEQISYDYLFHERKESLYLFNEQVDEFNDLLGQINQIEYLGIKLINSFQQQAESLDKMIKRNPISYQNWMDNYQNAKTLISSDLYVSAFISVALGSMKDGKARLSYLKDHKLQINDSNKLPENIDEKIFDESQPGIITDKLFNELKESYREELIFPYKRMIARYKKCSVFDRLLSINNRTKKNKTLFVLVSSAKSIERITDIAAKEEYEKYKIRTDRGNNQSCIFNPIRSVRQIYLNLLVRNGINKNKIEELKHIKEFVELKGKENEYTKQIDDQLIEEYENELSNLRESYENDSLLLNLDNRFQENLLKRKDIERDYKNIFLNIQQLMQIANEKNILKELKSISLTKFKFIKEYEKILMQAMETIAQGNREFDDYTGKDPVTSIYTALPLVYFKEGSDKFKGIIEQIIKYVQGLGLPNNPNNRKNSRDIIQSINEVYFPIFLKAFPNDEEKVIMLIIILMLNVKNDENDDPNNIAYNRVCDILQSVISDESWRSAFLYIKSWIARRLRKYDESINTAKQGLELKAEDPRFYHSIYLNKYCLYYEEKDKNKKNDYLTEAITNCEKAYNLYKSQKNNENIFIEILAILNGLTYLHTLKYQDTRLQETLESARHYFDILMNQKEYSSQIAEFLHTEALLEKEEYLASKKTQGEKLEDARKKIKKAIQLKPKSDYYILEREIDDLWDILQKFDLRAE